MQPEKVDEKLKYFVEKFVAIYENTLIAYKHRIDGNIQKPGTVANSLINVLGIAKSTTEIFEGSTKALSIGISDIFMEAIRFAGGRYNRNEVKKILDHLYSFEKEPDRVRKELVSPHMKSFAVSNVSF